MAPGPDRQAPLLGLRAHSLAAPPAVDAARDVEEQEQPAELAARGLPPRLIFETYSILSPARGAASGEPYLPFEPFLRAPPGALTIMGSDSGLAII